MVRRFNWKYEAVGPAALGASRVVGQLSHQKWTFLIEDKYLLACAYYKFAVRTKRDGGHRVRQYRLLDLGEGSQIPDTQGEVVCPR